MSKFGGKVSLRIGHCSKNRGCSEIAGILQEKIRQRVAGVRMLIPILGAGEQAGMLGARYRAQAPCQKPRMRSMSKDGDQGPRRPAGAATWTFWPRQEVAGVVDTMIEARCETRSCSVVMRLGIGTFCLVSERLEPF